MTKTKEVTKRRRGQSGSKAMLCGLITAVEELREFRAMYEKHPTSENRGYIRFAEMSVIQMADSLFDKTHKLSQKSLIRGDNHEYL